MGRNPSMVCDARSYGSPWVIGGRSDAVFDGYARRWRCGLLSATASSLGYDSNGLAAGWLERPCRNG
jgi:hypothetical protein